jgi:hypothetical protein
MEITKAAIHGVTAILQIKHAEIASEKLCAMTQVNKRIHSAFLHG